MSFVERLSSLGAGTVSRVLCREVVLFGSWDSKSCPL